MIFKAISLWAMCTNLIFIKISGIVNTMINSLVYKIPLSVMGGRCRHPVKLKTFKIILSANLLPKINKVRGHCCLLVIVINKIPTLLLNTFKTCF